MTIAIQRNSNKETVFFDAVINYQVAFQSTLTKHPIDGILDNNGNYIVSDHIVNDSPTYTIKGVFSSADFNVGRPVGSEYKFMNDYPIEDKVHVLKSGDSLITKAVSSFLPLGRQTTPQITMSPRSNNVVDVVKSFLKDIRDNRETVTLVEFTNGTEDSNASLVNTDLVITNIQYSEDAQAGDVLSVDITLQQAFFSVLKTTKVARNVAQSIQDKAAPTANHGQISSPTYTTTYDEMTKFLRGDAGATDTPVFEGQTVTAGDVTNYWIDASKSVIQRMQDSLKAH